MIREISHTELFHNILLNLGWKASEISKEKGVSLKKGGLNITFNLRTLGDAQAVRLIIYQPIDFQIPSKKDFYQRYLDHNYLICCLIDMTIDKYEGFPSILLIDSNRAFLIDPESREVILYCDTNKEQQENLYPLLEKKKVMHGLPLIVREKSAEHHGKELYEWICLWATELGSRFSINRSFIELFIRKIIFLRVYELLFPRAFPYFSFKSFLQSDESLISGKFSSPRANLGMIEKVLGTLYNQHGIDVVNPDKNTSFILSSKAVKESSLIWRFLSEINLLSERKFVEESLIAAFVGESDRRKFIQKKFSGEEYKAGEHLVHNQAYVLTPALVEVREEGIEETLNIFSKIFKYWLEYNSSTFLEIRRGALKPLALDLFMDFPKFVDSSGLIENLFAFIFEYSIRLRSPSQTERELVEFLLYLKMLFLMKQHNISLQVFPSLSKVWEK